MLKVIAPPWLALGFYRGVKLYNYKYNYKYNYEVIEYKKKIKNMLENQHILMRVVLVQVFLLD